MHHDDKIIIVGAGVFGLSTALHLHKRGYKNIEIFDRQPYDVNYYSFLDGADAASADENKIIRSSYGDRVLYQRMAFAAMPVWQEWNSIIAQTPPADLPATLSPDTKLWNNCGYLRVTDQSDLDDGEKQTQANFPQAIKHTQYRISDPQRRRDALTAGIPASKLDPFDRIAKGLPTDGILDMTAGFALASRACTFALHLCRKAGIKLHLGPDHALTQLLTTSDSPKKKVTGIRTAANTTHHASLVIIACGGWTPTLLPQTENLLETTSGSVLAIRIPETRPDLWHKYSPTNFPVWEWNMARYNQNQPNNPSHPQSTSSSNTSNNIGGIYGLPLTPSGLLKLAFRGTKYTSYTHTSPLSHKPISHPWTSTSPTHDRSASMKIPSEALRVLRSFCAENLPDLLDLPIEYERLCWYTDSVDNSFLIDYVPGFEGLVVASGGSGHGFKFLPVLGEHVVDVVEGRRTEYTEMFRWRDVPEGKRNGLEEGPEGWRTLDRQRLVGKEAWRGEASKL